MYLKLPNVQLKVQERGEQDGGGVGGRGVHLSPRIHQDTPSDIEVHVEYRLRAERST